MIENGDICPSCGAHQMPPWKENSSETGRCCQSCSAVEYKVSQNEKDKKEKDMESEGKL